MKWVTHTILFVLCFCVIALFFGSKVIATTDVHARLQAIKSNESLSHNNKIIEYQNLLQHAPKKDITSLQIYDYMLLEHLDRGNYSQVKNVFNQISFSQTELDDTTYTNLFVKLTTYTINALLMLEDYAQAHDLLTRVMPLIHVPSINLVVRGDVYLAAGQYYVRTGAYKEGLQAFDSAEQAYSENVSETLNDVNRAVLEKAIAVSVGKLTKTVFYIGNTYYTMGDYQKAIDYYSTGIEQLGELAELEDLVMYNHNIAISLLYLKQWDQAMQYATLAANYANTINSEVFYAFSQEIIARALHGLGQTDSALVKLNTQVIPVFEENQQTQRLFEALSYAAMFNVSNQNWSNAEIILNTCEALLQTHLTKGNGISQNLTFLEASYLWYEHQNDFEKALYFHKLFANMNAADFALKREQEAQRLMIDYELDIAQEKAMRLEADNKMQTIIIESNTTKNNYFLIIIISTAGLLMGMAYLYIKERRTRNKMSQLAMTDPLTLCPNRRSVLNHAYKILEEYTHTQSRENTKEHPYARTQSVSMAVAIIDVDNFKNINDTFGHDVGDSVLKNISQVLGTNIRQNDVMGRYGGEEFILILPNASELDLHTIFMRIQRSLQAHTCELEDHQISLPITVSMGASIFEPTNAAQTKAQLTQYLRGLISAADKQVYKAKTLGRNQLSFTVCD